MSKPVEREKSKIAKGENRQKSEAGNRSILEFEFERFDSSDFAVF